MSDTGAAAAATTAAAAPTTTDEKKDDHINLRVVSQDSNEVFFKIKRTTPLRKLMDAYCQRNSLANDAVRFLFDGTRLQPDKTPKEMGMEDHDVIDVVLQQTGGLCMCDECLAAEKLVFMP